MQKILVVEDQDAQRSFLIDCIDSLGKDYKVYQASQAAEALEILTSNSMDLIYLDIGLPDMSGLELAMKIRQLPGYDLTWIVFLTTYTDYILEAFQKIHCYDYIAKPYQRSTITELTLKLTQPKTATAVEGMKFITFQMKGFTLKINLKDILFFEIYNKNCTVHTLSQKYVIKKTSLKKILEMVESDSFIQSHRSYIVNLSYIEKILKVQNSYEISFYQYSDRALLGETFKPLLMNKFGFGSDE